MAELNPALPPRHSIADGAMPARTVRDRWIPGLGAAETAGIRCMAYAGCSELLASPHDVDPRPALRERQGLAGVTDAPHVAGLEQLMAEVAGADLEDLKAEYSGLFEVGSQGPPAPIREDLQTGQRAGTREEVMRFYDFFGYVLGERFAWQPDHLSVQLEFMHYLCFREAEAGADAGALSFQLAQVDFTERHLARWVPQLAANVDRIAAGSLYGRVVRGVMEFITADLAWQAGTIIPAGGGQQPA